MNPNDRIISVPSFPNSMVDQDQLLKEIRCSTKIIISSEKIYWEWNKFSLKAFPVDM